MYACVLKNNIFFPIWYLKSHVDSLHSIVTHASFALPNSFPKRSPLALKIPCMLNFCAMHAYGTVASATNTSVETHASIINAAGMRRRALPSSHAIETTASVSLVLLNLMRHPSHPSGAPASCFSHFSRVMLCSAPLTDLTFRLFPSFHLPI